MVWLAASGIGLWTLLMLAVAGLRGRLPLLSAWGIGVALVIGPDRVHARLRLSLGRAERRAVLAATHGDSNRPPRLPSCRPIAVVMDDRSAPTLRATLRRRPCTSVQPRHALCRAVRIHRRYARATGFRDEAPRASTVTREGTPEMDRWNTVLLVGVLVAVVVAALLIFVEWPCPMPACQTLENCPTECPVTDKSWIPVGVVGVVMGAILAGRLLITEARRRRR